MQSSMNVVSTFPYLDKLVIKKSVFYDDGNRTPGAMEKLYNQVRTKEQRMYMDQDVLKLPLLKNHPQTDEWAKRWKSSRRILRYFEKIPAGKVLDLGCGNGWFTHRLSLEGKHSVLGLDLNIAELEQAARLFATKNIQFLYGDLFSKVFPPKSFNYITVGATIQYFKDLPGLLNRLIQLVQPDGEIHLFDSPFYLKSNVEGARKRSAHYYNTLGFPEMANHYFHHVVEDLQAYNFKFLYTPQTNSMLRAIFNSGDIPFPWIRIQTE